MVISSAVKPRHPTFSVLNPVNIGEVLNTPIADSETEFNFTSISGERSISITNNASTKLTLNTRSSVGHTNSHSKTSTQFSSNIKNRIDNQQMLYQQQQSMGMSPDPWGEILFEHPMMQYSVNSPLSPESPVSSANSPVMPLGTSTDCENSFSWYVDGEELTPLPLSQSEDTMCLANAHLHINQPYKSPSDHSYASDARYKMYDDSCDDLDDGFHATDNRVLYRDTMVSDASKVINFFDEDTNLETVKNYNEILIKKEVDPIDDDCSASVDVYSKLPTTYSQFLKQVDESVERMGCPSTDPDEFALWKQKERIDFIKPENKAKAVTTVDAEVYELIEKKVDPITLSIPTRFSIKKESSKMKHPRDDLPKLSLNIPPPKVQSVLNYEQQKQLSTPDIIEETLNLEEGEFDLIKFICNQDFDVAQGIIATPVPSPKPHELRPESPVVDVSPPPSVPPSTPCMPKRKRSSVSFYENPGSVQSYQSSVDEPQIKKKKRGRPPKTESSLPSPSQLEGLTEQDLRYWEMRNKNNEASRRSRLHRKQKEQGMEEEATTLLRHHKYLQAKEQRLKKKVEWLETKLKEAIQ